MKRSRLADLPPFDQGPPDTFADLCADVIPLPVTHQAQLELTPPSWTRHRHPDGDILTCSNGDRVTLTPTNVDALLALLHTAYVKARTDG